MKDFSLDFDPTTESYTDMSFEDILSQYKLESPQDDSSGSDDSGYSPLYDDEDDDVRVYTPGSVSARRNIEPENPDANYIDDGYAAQDYDYDEPDAQVYDYDDTSAQDYSYDDTAAQDYDYDDTDAQDYGYDDSGDDDYSEEDNSKPFPTVPGLEQLKSFLKSKLKPKSERHVSKGRGKSEPVAADDDDYGYSDSADAQDYTSEYTDNYYSDDDYSYVPDGSGVYDSAPAQGTWQYDDGYDEPQPEAEPEYAPPATEHSGARGAMEEEARRYIAQMQADADYEQDYAEPEAEDDLPYDPNTDGYDADPTRFSTEGGSTVYSADSDVDEEIDSRFNLGGKRATSHMQYGSRAVDLSADENYAPTPQTGYSPTQWTPDYDDPSNDGSVEEEPPRKKHKFGRKKKEKEKEKVKPEVTDTEPEVSDKRTPIYNGFEDTADESDNYDDAEDYGFGADADVDGDNKKFSEEDAYFPPSFREYVLSLFASLILRLKGTARGDTAATMSDSEENLGPEVTPAAASKYYGSFTRSLSLRIKISAGLLVLLCYISLQLPLPGMLRTLPVSAAACFGLQAAIMLLSLDVVTTAVLKITRPRFGVDTLAVFSCLISGADALIVALSDTARAHIPLCALTSLSLFGILISTYFSVKGLRKATRVPSIGKRFYSVTGENKLGKKDLTLLKSQRPATGFVRRAEEAPPDETLFLRLAPILAVLALLFAIIVAAVSGCGSDFVYIFSALLAPTVPFMALSAFALPYFLGTARVFRVGGAIAGWSGLCDLGVSKSIIVTDRDLFPEECVTMESVRIFADGDAKNVISYAGTLVATVGSCAAGCFGKLMEENECSLKHVENFECLPGGGASGIIDGHTVLCGSTDLMRLMNIRIPFRLTDKTSVLLAIDGILYGIFSLHYEPMPQVRRALVNLVRSGRHPVFAIRDFNINPELLHNIFDIATDGYDFPPYVERFELSTPSDGKDSRIAAVVCNEGLGPLTEVADVGHKIYMSVRVNLLLTTLSAVIGVFTVFVKFLSAGSVSLGFILLFMLLWALLTAVASLYVKIR